MEELERLQILLSENLDFIHNLNIPEKEKSQLRSKAIELIDKSDLLEIRLTPFLNQLRVKKIKEDFFKSLLDESLKGKHELMDYLDLDSFSEANRLNNKNKLIRFPFGEASEVEFYYPLFQFNEDNEIYENIEDVIKLFPDEPYSLLNYLLEPCHYLRDLIPMDLIKIGEVNIIIENHHNCFMEMGDKQAITLEQKNIFINKIKKMNLKY